MHAVRNLFTVSGLPAALAIIYTYIQKDGIFRMNDQSSASLELSRTV